MMTILEDGAATHDAFCGASNEASNWLHYGEGKNHGVHPSARDRLMLGAAKQGLGRKDVHPCINWFKGIIIESDGSTTPDVGPFEAGRSLVLRAEMDLIVGFSNCPHPLDPGPDYAPQPVTITRYLAPDPAADDLCSTATAEAVRGFENNALAQA